jgi:hypothetical protein
MTLRKDTAAGARCRGDTQKHNSEHKPAAPPGRARHTMKTLFQDKVWGRLRGDPVPRDTPPPST